jgi:predicted transcriptional regulator
VNQVPEMFQELLGKEESQHDKTESKISTESGRERVGCEAPVRPLASATGQLPAVPIEMSVMPDYIVCLEDGRRFKMLKGHLRASYQLSPEDYRKKWGLPADYPMVAPNYRKKRVRMALDMGLGHMREAKSEKNKKKGDSKRAA